MLTPVGAGLPAMVANDNAGHLTLRGALRFFASKLAPTGSALKPVGAGLPAMVANDNASHLTLRGALRFFASKLAPTGVALKPVGAGLPAMVVNDNAGHLTLRSALSFFASKLAPTGVALQPVGAGLPAMVANDNAGHLTLRGVLRFFASKLAPTGVGLFLSFGAYAFDLQQLSDQLAKPTVIHGNFTQEKHLRALPQPLTSKGTFVLAKDHGLLWLLKTPLQQDYRINAQGIARRDANGWQPLPNKSAGAEQNRLFLAVLQGDSSGLQRDFELQLQGEAKAWKLTLIPRSLLLKQVFTQINIDGGELVHTIELLETQGDSTLLRMQDSTSTQPLSDAEQHDFAQ